MNTVLCQPSPQTARSCRAPAERLLWPGRASPSAPQLLAFSPGKEQRSHEEIRDEPRGWGHMPNAPDSPVRFKTERGTSLEMLERARASSCDDVGTTCFFSQAPPGSQASSRGEAKDSALLSNHDAGFLEPPEWFQGSPASSSVWRDVPFSSCPQSLPASESFPMSKLFA